MRMKFEIFERLIWDMKNISNKGLEWMKLILSQCYVNKMLDWRFRHEWKSEERSGLLRNDK